MSSCRLIVDDPAGGGWNMAVDEILLESVAASGESTLRVYQWAPATLSLGYFQPYADREQHPPSSACQVVRRRSGGGAITHDAEITYALILPTAHPAARDPLTMYLAVHGGVIQLLRRWGLRAELYAGEPREDQFLCFLRRSAGDLVVESHKVLGSAQRRARSAVLQHGSLLLRRSAFAPELPGVFDLGGRTVQTSQAVSELEDVILAALGMTPNERRLSATEMSLAKSAAEARFSADRWTQKR